MQNNNNFEFKPLEVSLSLQNRRLFFKGSGEGRESVDIDYTPPYGDGNGHTSLELLLLSLGSCVGSSLSLLLRKMQYDVQKLEVKARGVRRNEHPTCFKEITLEFCIKAAALTTEDFQKALKISEDQLCPVWAMLKNNVKVSTTFVIVS